MSSSTLILVLLLTTVALSTTHAFRPNPSTCTSLTLFPHQNAQQVVYSIRGGGEDDYETDSSSESDMDEYDESEEDEKEIEQEIEKLSASTKKVMEKSNKKRKAQVKQAVSDSLSISKKKKRSSGGTNVLKKIPYIVRAFMNPFTVFAMTKGYFASLFNIDYLQEDISQNLRSALQEKAKSSPPGGGGGGKKARKMKPGQAKTLSDLPQLSA